MVSISYRDALEIMTRDQYSQFERITTEKRIILPPKYLGQIRVGVTRQLDSELQLSSEKFKGVPIAYNDIKLLGPVGSIMDDQPFLHFDIQTDFIIFRPVIGCTLKGVVNKIFKNHVGCLVHGCFNASIHKPHHTGHRWKGHSLTIGEEFMFEVTGIFTNNRELSLRGSLKDESSQKTQEKGQTTVDGNTSAVELDSFDGSVFTGGERGSVHKKKKKKKSKNGSEETESSTISNKTMSSTEDHSDINVDSSVPRCSPEVNGQLDSDVSSKKKKKKKDKRKKEKEEDLLHNSMDLNISSKKKKKKKKILKECEFVEELLSQDKHANSTKIDMTLSEVEGSSGEKSVCNSAEGDVCNSAEGDMSGDGKSNREEGKSGSSRKKRKHRDIADTEEYVVKKKRHTSVESTDVLTNSVIHPTDGQLINKNSAKLKKKKYMNNT